MVHIRHLQFMITAAHIKMRVNVPMNAAASYSGPASQWFDGIRSDQLGERGYVLDGAAGDEIDRWDPNLGSPVGKCSNQT